MRLSKIILSATLALSSASVLASGGGGGYSGGGGGFGGGSSQRQVDQTYEVGKAIFKGRQAGVAKISYCVKSGSEKLPIKSKTIKAYKKSTYSNLSANLYNCDKPDTLAAEELSKDSLIYVLYYMNKRYRLNLQRS